MGGSYYLSQCYFSYQVVLSLIMPAGNGVSSTRWPLDTDWFLSWAGIQATDGPTPPPSDKWGTGQVCQRQVFVSRWGHQTVVHLLARFLLPRLYLSLVPAQSRLFSSISVSFCSNLCFSVSLLPSSPPQLLDDIHVFLGGQISCCFSLHGAFGFRLTAPVTCHSHGPTRSPLANQSRSCSWQLSQTQAPLAVSDLTSLFTRVLEIWNLATELWLPLLQRQLSIILFLLLILSLLL